MALKFRLHGTGEEAFEAADALSSHKLRKGGVRDMRR